MKDRYLFKAIKNCDKEWVIGFLKNEGMIQLFGKNPKNLYQGDYMIDKDTICQCTGLKDCEGNLIFEGDTLETKKYVGINFRYTVKFITDRFFLNQFEDEGMYTPHQYLSWDYFKKEGNIHD